MYFTKPYSLLLQYCFERRKTKKCCDLFIKQRNILRNVLEYASKKKSLIFYKKNIQIIYFKNSVKKNTL